MDRSNIVTLVKTVPSKDSFGQMVEEESFNVVPCTIRSVSASEFFQGGQNGLRPEWQLTIFSGDYNKEKECILEGVRYEIYRTYLGSNDSIELYL